MFRFNDTQVTINPGFNKLKFGEQFGRYIAETDLSFANYSNILTALRWMEPWQEKAVSKGLILPVNPTPEALRKAHIQSNTPTWKLPNIAKLEFSSYLIIFITAVFREMGNKDAYLFARNLSSLIDVPKTALQDLGVQYD